MTFNIITIFPRIFDAYFNESIIKRAQKNKLIKIKILDLRKYAKDKHHTVDDKPYGGGPGMLMKVEPVYKALQALKKARKQESKKAKKQTIKQYNPPTEDLPKGDNITILFTPTGKKFDQNMTRKLAKYDKITMLCPRYEGHDARIEKLVDEKISIGNYILTGGELPAMILVDSITRLIPGVIKRESLKQESFSSLKISAKSGSASGRKNYLQKFQPEVDQPLAGKINNEYPQYTRPEEFMKMRVPKILLSGNHAKIKDWKKKNSKTA